MLPNSYFDPRKGHALYNRYLDELELCAELGFDGVCVNEHHQNAYGLMPSPVVMASALARRTRDCRIAILGNAFCLREHPLTLAEEHAMIDVITGGRLIAASCAASARNTSRSAPTRSIRSNATRRRTISSCGRGPSPARSRSRASTITSNT